MESRAAVSLLRELIRNACVNDGSGCNESRSVRSLNEFFASAGLKGEVLAKAPGRDNLILRIPGTDPEAPSLAFMGHTDVVPARSEEWRRDPFAAELVDGEIWGRGAVDMLNMTAAQAAGFAAAAAAGSYPGDLLYLALADEEASGLYGAAWLTEEHWEKVRCDYMVSEIGGFFLDGYLGKRAAIGVGEKGVAWIRISSSGLPGHGSMPFGSRNAVEELLRAAAAVSRMKAPVVLSSLYKGMAAACAASPGEARRLSSPWQRDRALKEMFSSSPGTARFLDAASRLTVSVGRISGGEKINMIPERAVLELDLRIPPGIDFDSYLEVLRREVKKSASGAEVEILEYFPATVSPTKSPLVTASRELLQRHLPQADLQPILISGASDGRFWRKKGTAVYGFSLFDEEMSMDRFSTMIHGRDERISVDSMERSFDYFSRLPEAFFRQWRREVKG